MIGILTATATLIPSISSANRDDSKYPATNYQPKVIYQDQAALKAQGSTIQFGETSVFDPKYPATHFQPKVIFQDKQAIKVSDSKSMGEKSAFDPKYPAANFEPKVIYP